MRIHRLTYVSTAAANLQSTDVDDIVQGSQRRNGEAAITGILLFNGTNFLQTLEGEDAQLKPLLGRIQADVRHSGLILLGDGPCDGRAFWGWSLGYAGLNASRTRRAGTAGNGFDPSKLPQALPPELLSLYTSFDSLG